MRRCWIIFAVAQAIGLPGLAYSQTPDTKSLISMKGSCIAQFLGKPLA